MFEIIDLDLDYDDEDLGFEDTPDLLIAYAREQQLVSFETQLPCERH